MSCNIDRASYLSGRLTIDRELALDFIEDHPDEIPEICFLYDINRKSLNTIIINIPRWSGERSGYYFDSFKKVLSLTKGEAEILLSWERGGCINGLHVKDGVVTEKKVKVTLE